MTIDKILAEQSVDKSKLAQKMLEWEKRKEELERLEDEIKADVLHLGKSFKVGDIEAKYYRASRGRPDFKRACEILLAEDQVADVMEEHTKEVVDWGGIWKRLDGSELSDGFYPKPQAARVLLKLSK